MIIHVVLQKYFVKTLNCCINMLLLCIADIIGIYKDFLNKKGKRNKDFEALYYVWQGVQKYRFAKSQEKPHKTVNFQVQCAATHLFTYSLHMG